MRFHLLPKDTDATLGKLRYVTSRGKQKLAMSTQIFEHSNHLHYHLVMDVLLVNTDATL